MKILLLITACWLSCGTFFGQELKEDIAAMNKRLEKLSGYRITVDYAAGDTADFFDQGTAAVLVTSQGFFYQTDFAVMMINEQHTVILNDEEHTLIYSDNQKAGKKTEPLNDYILQGIDTLVSSADSVYFTRNGAEKIYHLRFKGGYFDLVELTFDGTYLNKVVYFYNEDLAGEQGLTAVCHVAVEENPTYDKQLLSSDYYLNIQNGKAAPAENFTGYVLIYNESIESSIE